MDTKKKRTPNQKKKAIVSVLLMVAILITGAFAFLSATDSKTNVFTVGNVKIKLSEEFDTNQNGSIEKTNDENDEVYDASETQVSLKGEILPGQEIIKRPYIENTGKNNAWVYVTVGIPTAQDVDIISKDGKTNLTGTEQKILIQAYAIQENYKNNNTYESTWNAYFEGKEENVFGPELTENIGTHIPIFTILNSNNKINTPNAGWKQIGEVYRSTNGYNYYVFGYETLLEAKENDSANWPKTEFCFEKVKLLSDIGENELTTLDYLIKETEKDTLQAEIALNESANVPDGYILLKREYYIPGEKVSSLYFDDNLAKNGYSFDWSYLKNPSKKAYAGMEITKPTELVASYVNRADTDNPTTSAKISDWLSYDILYDESTKSMYAILVGANANHPNYPSGSTTETVVVPATISAKWTGSTFEIENGTYEKGEYSHLYNTITAGTTYNLTVKKMKAGNSAPYLRAVTQKVVIGDTVEYIGDLFAGSQVLQNVVLPYRTTESNHSFYGCTALTDIYFPASFTKIGYEMFGQCTGLTELHISEGVQEIGVDSFIRCSNLTKVVTPDTLITIKNGAFAICPSINDFTWGSNIEEIGYYCAWKWTKGLTMRINNIDNYCNVKSVWLSNGSGMVGAEQAANHGYEYDYMYNNFPQYYAKTYIDNNTNNQIEKVVLSKGITNVCSYAFTNNKSLKSVTFPSTLKTIGVEAFINTNLSEVVLPMKLEIIGARAFRDCPITKITINSDFVVEFGDAYQREIFGGITDSSIQHITLGPNVTAFNVSATGLKQLKEITVDEANLNLSSEDGILYNKEKTVLIKFPNKKQMPLNIPNSVTTIGDEAFSGCSALTNITIPDNITSIGENAFAYCSALKNIIIPDSVTNVGSGAFACCTGLTNITIPNSVMSIGDSTFSNCSKLSDITISNNVTSIGNSVFYRCASLTNITIPNSVTTIGDNAFCETGLTNIVIPDSTTSIGYYAFAYCNKLTSVTIGNGVTNIGFGAFTNCNLTNITIPNSVTSIEGSAFSGCQGLTSITIPDSVTSIGNWAFDNCFSLTSITYQGTVSDWAKVDCPPDLFASGITITCTDGTVTTQ